MSARALLLLVCALGVTLAGGARANSVYSAGGLGEPMLEEQARLRALGGAGVAEHGPRGFSLANPASLAEVQHLLLEGTIVATTRWVEATSYPEETLHETLLPSVHGAIALPGRIVFGGGYIAARNAAFHAYRSDSSGAASVSEIDGTGGMNYVRATLSRQFTREIRLGLDYDFIVGNYREEWTRSFPDSGIQDARDTLEISWETKGRLRVGVQFVRGGLALGAVYEVERDLPLQATRRAYGVVVSDPSRTLTIPAGYVVGFSAPVSRLVRAVGQYRHAAWQRSSVQSDLVDFRAEQRFSFGVERTPVLEEGASFWSRIPLRLGGYYLLWPDLLPVAGGADISAGTGHVDEWAVTLGSGIASQDRGGSIDFSLEVGRRGDREVLGASEKFLRFGVSFFVSDETWKGTLHK